MPVGPRDFEIHECTYRTYFVSVRMLVSRLPETVFKEKRGVWDPMPELSPYLIVDSEAKNNFRHRDQNTFYNRGRYK